MSAGILPEAADIIAELLKDLLITAHLNGRRFLYSWERDGLRWLAHRRREFPDIEICAWTGDRVRAFEAGRPILPGWGETPEEPGPEGASDGR